MEHHDTAVRHGAAAARHLLGDHETSVDEHFFWSDQYRHTVQSLGDPTAQGDRVVRGSPAEGSFAVPVLDDDRIRGLLAMDRPQDLLAARRLMATSQSVTAEQLADESTPLKSLLLRGRRRPEVRT